MITLDGSRHVVNFSGIYMAALVSLTLCSFTPLLNAQDGALAKGPYKILYFDVSGDALMPRSSSASTPTQFCNGFLTAQQVDAHVPGCAEQFSNAGGGGFAMGVRPIRYLQIDAVELSILTSFNGFGNRTSTFQCVSGCAGITGPQTFNIGTSNGLVTTGARAVLPLFRDHLLVSAGGGFGRLRSLEHANSNGGSAACDSCQFAAGHGPTEVVEVMYFPNQHLGFGVHARNVQINSSGLTTDGIFSNAYLGTTYKDQFFMIGGSISIRVGKTRE